MGAFDVEPRHSSIVERDALSLTADEICAADCFITNLPWSRELLHPLIGHLRQLLPLWTIIDANWAHTRQAGVHLIHCSRIISIGRVLWIPGTASAGKEDSAWYRFEADPVETIFLGRAA